MLHLVIIVGEVVRRSRVIGWFLNREKRSFGKVRKNGGCSITKYHSNTISWSWLLLRLRTKFGIRTIVIGNI